MGGIDFNATEIVQSSRHHRRQHVWTSSVDFSVSKDHQNRDGIVLDAKQSRWKSVSWWLALHCARTRRTWSPCWSLHLHRDRLLWTLLPEGEDENHLSQLESNVEWKLRPGARGKSELEGSVIPRWWSPNLEGEVCSRSELLELWLVEQFNNILYSQLSRQWLKEVQMSKPLKLTDTVTLNTLLRFVPAEISLRRVPTSKPGALFGAKLSTVLK